MPGSVKNSSKHLRHTWAKRTILFLDCDSVRLSRDFTQPTCWKVLREILPQNGLPLFRFIWRRLRGARYSTQLPHRQYYQYFTCSVLNSGRQVNLNGSYLKKLARPEHLKAENMAQVIPFINQLYERQMGKERRLRQKLQQNHSWHDIGMFPCGQYFIDTQDYSSYTFNMKKEVLLSLSIFPSSPRMIETGVAHPPFFHGILPPPSFGASLAYVSYLAGFMEWKAIAGFLIFHSHLQHYPLYILTNGTESKNGRSQSYCHPDLLPFS